MSFIVSIRAAVDNESTFNVLCHRMAKNNVSLAYKYIANIFDSSITSKDRCNDAVKAFFLIVRIFPLCVPGINRITQFALRLLSPPLTIEFVESSSYFGVEERKIRYSTESCLVYLAQDLEKVQNPDRFTNALNIVLDEEEQQQMQQNLLDLLQDPDVLQNAFQDPNGPFIGLSQEDRQNFSHILQDPGAFQIALQNAAQNPEEFFGPLSEQGEEELNSWIKSNGGIENPTQIQDDLELD